jgi:hypothetical protein
MRAFDSIITTQVINDTIGIGIEGTIVEVLDDHTFLVECVDVHGNTLDVALIHAHQMTVTLQDYRPQEWVVALTDTPPILRGQIGIIQERVGVGLYRIRFLSDESTSLTTTLHAHQILRLHGTSILQEAS